MTEGTLVVNGQTYIRLPLTPEEINSLLKKLDDDADRVLALDGICKCGAVTEGSRCWGCYESGGDW